MHLAATPTGRETRSRARETKFVTDIGLRPQLLRWARERLGPDGHGEGAHFDEYHTSTLYLETPEFDTYHRHGSYGRSKYRIRRYGRADAVFLERKFRTERLLAKRRTRVPLADLERMVDLPPDPTWDGAWFVRRVRLRQLRPLVQLSYDRVARVGTSSTGPIRLTIDANMHALPLPDYAYLPGCGQPFLEQACIVEVKYQMALPALFRELAETFDLRVQKISKFRTGLRSLDYPLGREADEQIPHALVPAALDPAGHYAD